MTESTIPLALYLFNRIKQLGIEHILGVPGDFNLQLLDFIYKVPELKWVGCCNELNAAYAADGFGRIKGTGSIGNVSEPGPRLPGVLITTYGVGELSALNGVSGAFAETVPLLHIVGTTGRAIQEDHLLIHHVRPSVGLEPADHTIYMETSKPFSCAHEFLLEPKKAAHQIDRVITEVIKNSRPGYLYIPADMVHAKVPESLLHTPLDLSLKNSDVSLEDNIVDDILAAIYASKSPIILADIIAARFNLTDAIQELVETTQFWSFTTPLGKGLIDETSPKFVGVYNGSLSLPGVAEAVHDSDLVINFGPLLSDSNTGGLSREIKEENLIALHPLYVSVKGKLYKDIQFVPVVKKLLQRLDKTKLPVAGPKPKVKPLEDPPTTHISQEYLVKALSKFVRPKDTVVVESGTFQFAVPDADFKENTSFITQIFYSSIGYALPAALGAAIAARERNQGERIVLVEGDGSAQMTIQELGTMVRHKLPITIFLLNNDGYSIERAIWGPEQKYNDICPGWNWTQLLSVFGGKEGETVANYKVTSREEFETLLSDKNFNENTNKVQLVEVVLDAFDYPWLLKAQVQRMGPFNVKKGIEYAKKRNEI
ncbi:indolepyruvate decarboxylase 1 [Sugiyamaella lignohabitans]|uniref:Indolepyruvate decarboxylase 1 n=1 Tax=Sugiyamaella lignohabitans TaxID=796027 RepID=A0A167DVI6_9ASCO|nr:indolepyruvate decarboxylase 1 [Sugiyamaella lignohabitans]ANB13342.1 indolepyruvate decarboxylase 1 [Sugiyamaella lignohabitans]